MKNQASKRTLGIVIFLIGLLLVSSLNALLMLPGLESFYYFSSEAQMEHQALGNLSCPKALGAGEQGIIRLTISNGHTREVTTPVMVRITQRVEDRYERVDALVGAGETESYTWSVGKEDLIYERMILAHFTTLRTVNSPIRQGICAIAVLPWAVNGSVVLYGGAVGGVLAILVGGGMWLRRIKPKGQRRPLVMEGFLTLAGVTLLGLAASLAGLWMGGLVAIILTVLVSLVLAANLLQSIES